MALPRNILPPGPTDPLSVGVYRILGRITTGPTGPIYLSRAVGGAWVAVRVVPTQGRAPDEDGEEVVRARFAAAVDHARAIAGPQTCAVLDVGMDQTPFLVTEFVDGPTLAREVAERGPLSPTELHRLAGAVLAALESCRRVGRGHSDLRPDDVILSMTGPRLVDLGVAGALRPLLASMSAAGPDRRSTDDLVAWSRLVVLAGTGHDLAVSGDEPADRRDDPAGARGDLAGTGHGIVVGPADVPGFDRLPQAVRAGLAAAGFPPSGARRGDAAPPGDPSVFAAVHAALNGAAAGDAARPSAPWRRGRAASDTRGPRTLPPSPRHGSPGRNRVSDRVSPLPLSPLPAGDGAGGWPVRDCTGGRPVDSIGQARRSRWRPVAVGLVTVVAAAGVVTSTLPAEGPSAIEMGATSPRLDTAKPEPSGSAETRAGGYEPGPAAADRLRHAQSAGQQDPAVDGAGPPSDQPGEEHAGAGDAPASGVGSSQAGGPTGSQGSVAAGAGLTDDVRPGSGSDPMPVVARSTAEQAGDAPPAPTGSGQTSSTPALEQAAQPPPQTAARTGSQPASEPSAPPASQPQAGTPAGVTALSATASSEAVEPTPEPTPELAPTGLKPVQIGVVPLAPTG